MFKVKKSIKLLGWNINGRAGFVNYVVPVRLIIDSVIKIQPDIIVLTEFIRLACGFCELKNAFTDLGYDVECSKYQINTNGILIASKKEIQATEIDTTTMSKPNYLAKKLKINEKELLIVGTRIIPTDDWKERKEQLDNLIEKLETHKNTGGKFIVIGDFNNGNIQYESNKDFEYPKTCERHSYNYQIIWRIIEEDKKWSLITPDQGGPYNNGKFSIITKDNKGKTYHTKDDHIISSLSKDNFSNYDYIWSFVSKENGYGDLTKNDYLSDLIGLPDHAILVTEISI